MENEIKKLRKIRCKLIIPLSIIWITTDMNLIITIYYYYYSSSSYFIFVFFLLDLIVAIFATMSALKGNMKYYKVAIIIASIIGVILIIILGYIIFLSLFFSAFGFKIKDVDPPLIVIFILEFISKIVLCSFSSCFKNLSENQNIAYINNNFNSNQLLFTSLNHLPN